MTLRDYVRELAFPASSSVTLFALVTFVLLIGLALFAGLFGIWLIVATVPAFLRYLTMIAEARARNVEAAPPGIEFFTLVGNAWTLFPVVPVLLMAYLVRETGMTFGELPAMFVALGFAALLPAIIGVLVITHSALQSMDPRALDRFIRGCGVTYWYAPATAVIVVLAPMLLGGLSIWIRIIVEMYLFTAFFAVIGAVTRESKLVDEVDIPDAIEPDVEKVLAGLDRERVKVVNHAYGFASRGNRDGGLEHVYDWLVKDPDPNAAWPWFLGQMLRWEDTYPALLLAQQYLGRLLEHNDRVAAVKLMLRCRLVNADFRPLTADLPTAIVAAEACQNYELAESLKG
jgi:heme/copper-type cytochrome/quinol oxidase subunit 2